MLKIAVLSFVLFHCTFLCASVSIQQQEQAIKLAHTIIKDKAQIPKLVRFAFHACFGDGCNGCLNIDDPNNAGLGEIYEKLNQKYEILKAQVTSEPVMSRADFWAVCEVEAGNIATRTTNVLQHKFGRKDCPTSPYYEALHNYPNPLKDFDHVNELFGMVSQFGLSKRLVVALVGGGHSIGSLHTEFSGFGTGPWDDTEDLIDENFFYVLANDEWKQKLTKDGKHYQWVSESRNKKKYMLNTDMALYHKLVITDPETGRCDTDESSGLMTTDPATSKLVEMYSKQGDILIEDFLKAYQILMDNSIPAIELHPAGGAQTKSTLKKSDTLTFSQNEDNSFFLGLMLVLIGVLIGSSCTVLFCRHRMQYSPLKNY